MGAGLARTGEGIGDIGCIARHGSRFARGLALAAMLVQFIASYDHIHPEDFDFLNGHLAPVLTADYGPHHAPIPAGAIDDDCAICAAMHMAGSAPLPVPPVIAAPSKFGAVAIVSLAAIHLSSAAYSLFRSRAPPVA
jgi:hypothetical protein